MKLLGSSNLLKKKKKISEPYDKFQQNWKWLLGPRTKIICFTLLSITLITLTHLSSIQQALCNYKAIYFCVFLRLLCLPAQHKDINAELTDTFHKILIHLNITQLVVYLNQLSSHGEIV